MAGDSGKKLFVGPRFRRIRQQLGLSQTQIAEGLGISPSYINLIERNQRPVTAQILLRLAEAYDLDLRDLATADEDRFFAELNEIFSDPLFRQIDLPKQELRDLAELCPGVTHSLQRLYAAYTEARRGETLVAAQMADRDEGARFEANPIERVRDLIEANRNYFPELEQAAENLRDELNVPSEELFAALSTRLREKHSIVTRIMPVDVMRETLRRFDRHRRQLLISELVDGPGRAFQLAFQIGLAECSGIFEAIVNRAGPLDDTPRRLYRITLANYFAAAVMMPYQAFHAAAEALELRRPCAGAAFQCRLRAGLPSPDHAAAAQCARRAVLPAARRQCRQCLQAIFLRHLSVFEIRRHLSAVERALDLRHAGPPAQADDRTARRRAGISRSRRWCAGRWRRIRKPQPRFAIGLGCEIRHAARLVYATGMDLEKAEGTPIGVNCRLCERENCSQRAEPPITRTLILDENTRRVSSFAFSNAREL